MKVKKTDKGNVKLVMSLEEATSLYHLLVQSSMEEWVDILERNESIDIEEEEGHILDIYSELSIFIVKR